MTVYLYLTSGSDSYKVLYKIYLLYTADPYLISSFLLYP